MSTNITTLILNLMISESKLHRIRLAGKIIDVLEENVPDFGRIEKLMRNHFINMIMAYVENPYSSKKDLLFELADFYKEYYIDFTSSEVLTVAA